MLLLKTKAENKNIVSNFLATFKNYKFNKNNFELTLKDLTLEDVSEEILQTLFLSRDVDITSLKNDFLENIQSYINNINLEEIPDLIIDIKSINDKIYLIDKEKMFIINIENLKKIRLEFQPESTYIKIYITQEETETIYLRSIIILRHTLKLKKENNEFILPLNLEINCYDVVKNKFKELQHIIMEHERVKNNNTKI